MLYWPYVARENRVYERRNEEQVLWFKNVNRAKFIAYQRVYSVKRAACSDAST